MWSAPNSGAPFTSTWQNGDVAGFQNAGTQTVTVTGAVSTAGLQFGGGSGSTLSLGGSALTLTGSPYLYTQANGIAATVSAPLAGSNTGLTIYRPSAAGPRPPSP